MYHQKTTRTLRICLPQQQRQQQYISRKIRNENEALVLELNFLLQDLIDK